MCVRVKRITLTPKGKCRGRKGKRLEVGDMLEKVRMTMSTCIDIVKETINT